MEYCFTISELEFLHKRIEDDKPWELPKDFEIIPKNVILTLGKPYERN